MEDTLYTDLIAKYLSGNIEATEREILLAWVESDTDNRKFFDQMVEVWGISADFDENNFDAADTAVAWSKVEARLFGNSPEANILKMQPKPSIKIAYLSKKRVQWAAAAVTLLAISVVIWLYINPSENQSLVVYHNNTTKPQEYLFPDSSKVWLNVNTTVSFDKNFEERIVQLQGEAFFEVKHLVNGKRFMIHSGEAATTVLGTTFNVRAYPNEEKVVVTVKSGKVELSDVKKENQTKLLLAGKSGIFDKKRAIIEVVEAPRQNVDALKTQFLEFDRTPMSEVVPTLEQFYNIKIKVDDLAILDCPINMDRDTPSLSEIIKTIEFSIPVKFEKIDTNIYILKGAGCK